MKKRIITLLGLSITFVLFQNFSLLENNERDFQKLISLNCKSGPAAEALHYCTSRGIARSQKIILNDHQGTCAELIEECIQERDYYPWSKNQTVQENNSTTQSGSDNRRKHDHIGNF